jgi:uncharacterized delta-60 repeat protein
MESHGHGEIEVAVRDMRESKAMTQKKQLWGRLLVALAVTSVVFVTATPSTSARLTDGFLDSTFGTSGIVTTSVGGSDDRATDTVVQSDGKILVTGTDGSAPRKVFVARYLTNGSLDSSFGSAGIAIPNIGTIPASSVALALQSDGRIVVVGTLLGSPADDDEMFAFRLTSTGVLDTTFGAAGVVRLDIGSFHDRAADVVVQPDDKVIVVGNVYKREVTPESEMEDFDNVALVRLNANGERDSSFGSAGVVNHDLGDNRAEVAGAALQPDGKIIVTGAVREVNEPSKRFATWRFLSNGSPDSSFGVGGLAMMALGDLGGAGASAVVQSDGKIVVAGMYDAMMSSDFLVVRYVANGDLDAGFGTSGATRPLARALNGATDIALQSDGKIVVVGGVLNDGSQDNVVVRLTASGDRDTSFGDSGAVLFGDTADDDYLEAVALQTDGKIVVAGTSSQTGIESSLSVAVARIGIGSTLASLTLSTGTLTPVFSALVTSYVAEVSGTTSSVTVTPVAATSGATVKVANNAVSSGAASPAIELAVGENSVPITVTSPDGVVTSTYTIVITRLATAPAIPQLSSVATLASLSVSSGSLVPVFSPTTTTYRSTVGNKIKSVLLSALLTDKTASMTINSETVSTDAASRRTLKVGTNTFRIAVVAQNGVSRTEYTVVIVRDIAQLGRKKSMTVRTALASADVKAPARSKVALKSSAAAKRICSIASGKITGVRKGTCVVTISVTPRATAKVKKPKTVKSVVRIRVV